MTGSEESEERTLRERLAALREDPAGLDFQATLHRRLVAAGPPEPAPGWDRVRWFFRRGAPWLWPVLGAAAGIAAFLLMGALQQPPPPLSGVAEASRPLAMPGTQVPVSKVAVIKLDFHGGRGRGAGGLPGEPARGPVVLGRTARSSSCAPSNGPRH